MKEIMESGQPQETGSGHANYWVAGIVALIIIAGLVWYAGARKKSDTSSKPIGQSAQSQNQAAAVVEYTESGFSPKSVTIKSGDTVSFVNKSSGDMWVATAPHPLHDGYDGTPVSVHCTPGATPSFDECDAVPTGGSYSFTFNRVGTWPFHNHINPTQFGTVTVQ